MDVIDGRDLVDAEPIDHGMAQEVALARHEGGDGVGERATKLRAVVLLQVRELGIRHARRERVEAFVVE